MLSFLGFDTLLFLMGDLTDIMATSTSEKLMLRLMLSLAIIFLGTLKNVPWAKYQPRYIFKPKGRIANAILVNHFILAIGKKL